MDEIQWLDGVTFTERRVRQEGRFVIFEYRINGYLWEESLRLACPSMEDAARSVLVSRGGVYVT